MTNALPPMGTDLDVVALVESDHRAIRALLDALAGAPPEGRRDRWPEVLRSLVVHEVAEEVVLYPAIRVITEEPEPVVRARLAEQRDAEELLVAMEQCDPSSGEFAALLGRLRAAVAAHAAAEERDILPIIAAYDDALDRPSLGARYVTAKRRAPTHPHPNAPQRPPASAVAGPLLSFVDRVRDHLG